MSNFIKKRVAAGPENAHIRSEKTPFLPRLEPTEAKYFGPGNAPVFPLRERRRMRFRAVKNGGVFVCAKTADVCGNRLPLWRL